MKSNQNSRSLAEIVRNIETSKEAIDKAQTLDQASVVGDGYNVRYLEYVVVKNFNVAEGWIKLSNSAPNIGQLVSFQTRGSDETDRAWAKMPGLFFVLVDRETKWTKYQLFEFVSYDGDIKVPRSGGVEAYRYRLFTARCRARTGAGFIFDEQVYLKVPSLEGRTKGITGYAMATPDTFVVNASVDGHLLTISPDDNSLNRPGFFLWQVEQADDANGTNGTVLIYGQNNMPAMLDVAPGTQKYYRIRAMSVTGDASAWTPFVSAVYNAIPDQPAWASHIYQEGGHAVTWSHPAPVIVNYFTLYRNTSASATGATVVATIPKYSTGYIIPYGSGGDYFGLKAVGYAGTDNGIVWFGPYSPTPASPSPTVQKVDLSGFVVSWPLVEKAISYEVQTATNSAGAGAVLATTLAQPANTATVYTETLRKAGFTHYRVRALGYGATVSGWSAWQTDISAPGQPSITKVTEDTNQVTIYIPSSYAKPVGFSHYIVQRADNGSGGNLATVDSAAGWAQTLSYPLAAPLKYYRLIAVDVAGNQSTPSAWVASAYVSNDPTIKDQFDTYGGNGLPLESIYWVQLDNFDSVTGWVADFGTISLKTRVPTEEPIYIMEGAASFLVAPIIVNGRRQISIRKSVNWDFSQDARFTDSDFITMAVCPSSVITGDSGDNCFLIRFKTDQSNYFEYATPLPKYWNNLKIKRSSAVAVGSPSWQNIGTVEIFCRGLGVSSNQSYLYVDDLRLVKADPFNPDTYSDTGGVWQTIPFADGSSNTPASWHVFPGYRNGEPQKRYSLGASTERNANSYLLNVIYRKDSNITDGTIQVGIYWPTPVDGGAEASGGILFYGSNLQPGSLTAYYAELSLGWYDSYPELPGGFLQGQTAVDLYKIENGVKKFIAHGGGENYKPPSFIHQNKIYWLGIDLREFISDNSRIKVYLSDTEGAVVSAKNLIISTRDPYTKWPQYWNPPLPAHGAVGLVFNDSFFNLRFVDFTAGSPAHAELADVAKVVDGPMIDGLDGDKRVYLAATEVGLAFSEDDKLTWQTVAGASTVITDHTQLTNIGTNTHAQIDSFIAGIAATVRGVALAGLSTATATLITVSDTILSALGKLQAQITAHTGNTSNPHGVTKAQVGLGSVDNTSDANKPVSTATATALAGKQPLDADLTAIAALAGTSGLLKKTAADTWALDTTAYITSAGAPVQSVAGKTGSVTLAKSDVGLGNVDNTADANKPVSTAQAAADNLRVLANTAITGATKTKVTYDAKGLVTGGADATQDDIAAGATYGRLTNTQITDLTDAGDSTLHYHAADRARSTHTGTQTAGTISDFAATVLATVLTGLSTATSTAITATDSVLSALGKLQAQVTARVVANTAITAATKTKVTYDAKGLVTGGADATQDDIAAGATYGRLTNTQITDLTDAGDSTLHYHAADRARSTHTGTQTAGTISDFAATVLATVLTGLSTATSTAITATDSVLSALGKLQAQVTARVTGVTGTAPIVSSGGMAPVISINAATTSAAGSMSAADKAKLDNATAAATASRLVMRDASGDVYANRLNTVAPDSTNVSHIYTGYDQFIRKSSIATVRDAIGATFEARFTSAPPVNKIWCLQLDGTWMGEFTSFDAAISYVNATSGMLRGYIVLGAGEFTATGIALEREVSVIGVNASVSKVVMSTDTATAILSITSWTLETSIENIWFSREIQTSQSNKYCLDLYTQTNVRNCRITINSDYELSQCAPIRFNDAPWSGFNIHGCEFGCRIGGTVEQDKLNAQIAVVNVNYSTNMKIAKSGCSANQVHSYFGWSHDIMPEFIITGANANAAGAVRIIDFDRSADKVMVLQRDTNITANGANNIVTFESASSKTTGWTWWNASPASRAVCPEPGEYKISIKALLTIAAGANIRPFKFTVHHKNSAGTIISTFNYFIAGGTSVYPPEDHWNFVDTFAKGDYVEVYVLAETYSSQGVDRLMLYAEKLSNNFVSGATVWKDYTNTGW